MSAYRESATCSLYANTIMYVPVLLPFACTRLFMRRFQDITLMGMRNGIVDRWDSREQGGKTDQVVNMAERPSLWKMTPTIDYLRVIHGDKLLVRTMRGEVRIMYLIFEMFTTHPWIVGNARLAVPAQKHAPASIRRVLPKFRL